MYFQGPRGAPGSPGISGQAGMTVRKERLFPFFFHLHRPCDDICVKTDSSEKHAKKSGLYLLVILNERTGRPRRGRKKT